MMECVILFRNPNNDAVGFISRSGEEDNYPNEIEVFESRDEAIELALSHPLLKHWPYQIVELDEL